MPEGTSKELKSLSVWVAKQRNKYRKGQIDEHDKDVLDEIGFVWKVDFYDAATSNVQRLWDAKFEKIVAYHKKYDSFRVVQRDGKVDVQLQDWASKQRRRLQRNRLAPERVAQLDSIGFFDDIPGHTKGDLPPLTASYNRDDLQIDAEESRSKRSGKKRSRSKRTGVAQDDTDSKDSVVSKVGRAKQHKQISDDSEVRSARASSSSGTCKRQRATLHEPFSEVLAERNPARASRKPVSYKVDGSDEAFDGLSCDESVDSKSARLSQSPPVAQAAFANSSLKNAKGSDDSDCDVDFSSDEDMPGRYEADIDVSGHGDGEDDGSDSCNEAQASIHSSTLSMNDRKRKRRVVKDTPVETGRRVEVYWSGDEEYYEGVVARSGKGGKIFIEYDDGDSEWRRMDERVQVLSD